MIHSRMGWKVPNRQVYCDTFAGWLRACWHCHIALKFAVHR